MLSKRVEPLVLNNKTAADHWVKDDFTASLELPTVSRASQGVLVTIKSSDIILEDHVCGREKCNRYGFTSSRLHDNRTVERQRGCPSRQDSAPLHSIHREERFLSSRNRPLVNSCHCQVHDSTVNFRLKIKYC